MERDDLLLDVFTDQLFGGNPLAVSPDADGGRLRIRATEAASHPVLPIAGVARGLRWFQVDVFGAAPLSGNGVAVFPEAEGLGADAMQVLTRELRQFEAIFLTGVGTPSGATARIFTEEEELSFAGHPLLGAAAVLHHLAGAAGQRRWTIFLAGRGVEISTRPDNAGLFAEMDQGEATFGDPAPEDAAAALLDSLGLDPGHRHGALPVMTASTGLPYAILPVTAEGLAAARIRTDDFEARLARVGAKFAYLLDPDAPEGRSWDNRGRVEDIATGSAAGPAAALLWRHGSAVSPLILHQGRFTGRPSEITVRSAGPGGPILVGGRTFVLAEGRLLQAHPQ